MKIQLTFMLFFLMSCCFSQSGDNLRIKQNIISIQSGYNQFKDENLHSKVFGGLNLGTSFTHTRFRTNISEFSAGLNLSFLNTVYEEFPSALNVLLHGNYRYLFPVLSHEKLNYFFGPLTDMQFGTSAYFHWDESHFYFANYICGGIGNRISFNTGRFDLVFNLDLPIISAICRPEPNRQYKIDDMTFTGIIKNLSGNPEIAFPNRNFYVKAGLENMYCTGKMKRRSIGYQFKYHAMQAKQGEPYQFVEHTISYKFIL